MAVERNSIVVEEYLQVIYSEARTSGPVKAIHLAQRLESSPSTVHATLNRLQRDGLIEMGPKKEIKLTSEGIKKAEELTYRHQLVESFLCNTLGIPWHEVHHHAHILEHGLTPLVETKLAEFLGDPERCPHGTPMPGKSKLPAEMVFLNELAAGEICEVVVVQETLEDEAELMEYLQRHQVVPGKELTLLEHIGATGSIMLESGEDRFSLPQDVADKIGVLRR
ncbi:MAG: metal-dependent transcriptional regulator [bacterium]|nr:metal-dependent transcriptional regulator [bacterium]